MVWSEQIGASIIVPSDARADDPTDTRDYIILGEDVPAEIASAMTAGLIFHNKSGNTDGLNGNEPLYWALGITNNGGHLEMIAYYNVGNPTFAYTAVTLFSLGMRGVPSITLGSSNGAFSGAIATAYADQLTVTKQLQLTSTQDVSATTDGALVIGPVAGINLSADNNEIMARNNGVITNLLLNQPTVNNAQGTAGSAVARKDYVDNRYGYLGGAFAASDTISVPIGLPSNARILVMANIFVTTPAGVGAIVRIVGSNGYGASRTINVASLNCDFNIMGIDSDLSSGSRTYTVSADPTVAGQTVTTRAPEVIAIII